MFERMLANSARVRLSCIFPYEHWFQGTLGFPVGVQVVSLPYRDEMVLRVMTEIETALKGQWIYWQNKVLSSHLNPNRYTERWTEDYLDYWLIVSHFVVGCESEIIEQMRKECPEFSLGKVLA
jgi:hypothetical protein